ncbi:MAG: FHA domain-containing protein [Lachnospiraceae bacterium]|nr:FHA domain-containing protein [Lachnospiraceae bacterium]
MDIRYERKANQSFMVIEGEPCEVGYEEQMLRQNEVKILLSFYTIEMNRHIEYWHDITGKQSLRDYLEREGLNPETLRQVVLYLGIAYEELTRYLISQEHLYVSADTVFVKKDGLQVAMFFCYRPYVNMTVQEQLLSLWEYFLTIVDHKMEEFMTMCYEIYDLIMSGCFTMEEIQQRIQSLSQSDVGQVEECQSMPYVEKVQLRRENTEGEEIRPSKYDENKYDEELKVDEELWPTKDLDIRKWIQSICQAVMEKLLSVKSLKDKKKELYLPKKEEEDDLIYQPEEEYDRPTILLHGGELACAGKLLYEGSGEEEDILINKEVFRIGSKEKDNDAVLHSSGVSRYHARILKQGESYFLEDLNSKNGTYVNGKQLNYKEKLKLQSMDQVRFADALYRIV